MRAANRTERAPPDPLRSKKGHAQKTNALLYFEVKMIRLFSKNNLQEVAALAAYGFFVHLNLLILRPALPDVNGSWLYNSIMGFVDLITFGIPFLQALLFLLLSFGMAYAVYQLYRDLELTDAPSLLVPFCAFLLLGMFNRFFYFSPGFFAVFFLLYAARRLFAAYNRRALSPIFDAAVLIGIAGLIFAPSFFFIAFLCYYLLFIRTTNWRAWALSITGLLLPVYFLGAYLILTNQSSFVELDDFVANNRGAAIWRSLEPWRIAAFFAVLGIFGFTLSILFPHRFARNNIFMKDHFSMVLVMLGLSILAVLGFETYENSGFAFFIISLPMLLAYSFGAHHNVLKAEIIHVTLVLILLVFQYGPLL